ncbi:MAG: dynamin family protein [Firmicutes bacterium]|nr:dynamin family protein [Bacillota bacterium]
MEPVKILFTGTVSSGKSTLINALAGHRVCEAQNEICTAGISRVYNEVLDGCRRQADQRLRLKMRSFEKDLICFVDTPGVDSSRHAEHGEITRGALRTENAPIVVYVLNADGQLGVDATASHLKYVKEHLRGRSIIFALNKIDKYNPAVDSVERSISSLSRELEDLGFRDPVICPLSAITGLWCKLAATHRRMTSYETRRLEDMRDLFENEIILKDAYEPYFPYKPRKNAKHKNLLYQCGLTGLELFIKKTISDLGRSTV